MKTRLAALGLMMGLASPAAALPPLGDVPAIRDGLIDVAIAYEISQVCPVIRPRMLAGIGRLNGLKSTARQMGYSRDEIDAFIENSSEKARLESMARARLAGMGAVQGDVGAHCRVGQVEMARGSSIGSLLR